MGKLKLDIDPYVDLSNMLEHWCKWCEKVHTFHLDAAMQVYASRVCEGYVTMLQLCVEGRLIESKWKGLRR